MSGRNLPTDQHNQYRTRQVREGIESALLDEARKPGNRTVTLRVAINNGRIGQAKVGREQET